MKDQSSSNNGLAPWALIKYCFLLIFVCGSLASCYSSKNKPLSSYESNNTIEMKWELELINDNPTDSLLNEKQPLTIIFKDGSVNGYSGCNSFNGTYSMPENKIKMSLLATTRMMCEKMKLEDQFLRAVSGKLLDFKIESDILHIIDEENTIFQFRIK